LKHLTSDQLVSYHLNELSNNEKTILEKHLKDCTACENELNLIKELHNEWSNPVSVELSSSALNEIMMEVEQQVITTSKGSDISIRKSNLKNRCIHLVIAAAATFFIFQFQPTTHILNSNQQVVQTIEHTSTLMEKGREIPVPFSRFWKGDKQ